MGDYLLPRDASERIRLNLQHTVITRQFGGHLPPSLVVQPNARILDMCCGTGVWALELAEDAPPGVSLEACDISSANFPDNKSSLEEKIPANVQFSEHSVLSLPTEWTESFDIVYQRLLIAGLTKKQWVAALQELYRVTKPGGHLILIEVSPLGFDEDDSFPVPAQKELAGYRKTILESKGMLDNFSTLTTLVQECGFELESVDQMIFSTEGGLAAVPDMEERMIHGASVAASLTDDTLQCTLRLLNGLRPQILGAKMVTAERFENLLYETSVGWRDVPKTESGRGYPWIRINARKPLA